jgi:LIM homeobox protein 2/9
VELENQLSCFERDGHIYCKADYRRIYNVNKCARCLLEIHPSDLVMKARQYLFHVDCFRCATCATTLKKGDLFGMYEDTLYCRLHYELASADHPLSGPNGLPPVTSNGPFTPDPMGHSPLGPEGHPFPVPHGGLHHMPPFPPPPGGFHPPSGGQGEPPPGWYHQPPDFMVGNGPPPGDFPYENNNEPMLKKRRGRKKRKVETFAAMNGYLEAGGYPPGMDGQGGQGKTKRARTSFKHHQLRIMKHHFQINQNPDSRELKILSQKTQLDKKVLQVWFQNARAKWRRTRNQEPGANGPNGGSNPSASSTSGGIPVDNDDSELGLGSPSSDCSGPMIPCC